MDEVTIQQLIKVLIFASEVIAVNEEDLEIDLSNYRIVAEYDARAQQYIFGLEKEEE